MPPPRRPNPKEHPATAPHRPNPKEQYHHFIPRFVLRRFQCNEQSAQYVIAAHYLSHFSFPKRRTTKAPRRKPYRQTGQHVPEVVHFFSLATGKLEQRPIDSVYGVKDLYKDAGDADNHYKIEQDLSKLESNAARVIEKIHTASPSGAFQVKRRDLNNLRKFMFIMHFRQPFLSTEYFSEVQPTNASPSSRAWLLSYRQRHGLKSAADQWLHSLRYYLATPHHQILLDAQATMDKHGGPIEFHQKLATDRVDPNEDHMDAIAYDKQANFMYLGVWEAADGDEFVLGSNSFGLWEGLVDGKPEIHRFFLFSPRILVVLRVNLLRPENFHGDQIPADLRNKIVSPFFDIPLPPPVPMYRGNHRAKGIPAAELNQYRATPAALDDVFNFKITKLTPEQTFIVNHTLMINVRPSGSITFTSKEKMRRTLWKYLFSPLAILQSQNVYRYFPLLPDVDPTLPRDRDQASDTVFKEPGEIIDIPLFTMVINSVTGVHMYGSRFNRAFTIFMHVKRGKAKQTEFLSEVHYTLRLLRNSFLQDEGKDPPSHRTHAQAAALLKSTPDHVYEPIFRSLLNWGLKQSSGFGHATDPLSRLHDEVVIVSFIDWIARMYPDVYDALVGGTHDMLKFDGPEAQPKKSRRGGRAHKSKKPSQAVELGPVYSDGEILGDYIMKGYMHEIIAGQTEFRSNYDRALAIHKLATSDEEMKNPFSFFTRTVLPNFTARVIASSSVSEGSTKRMSMVESCSSKESKAFFDVMSRVAEKAAYTPPVPRGIEGHEEKFVVIMHHVMLVGLAKALASERSDILRVLFATGDLQQILIPPT